jgi:hypothetical protein
MGTREEKESRRDTRRRFEQWANNPLCQANTISAVHGISMADVATRESGRSSMGQSPFAIARGQAFERGLFRLNADKLLQALIKTQVLPAGSAGLADFRLRMNGGRCRSLDDARDETSDLLRQVASKPKNAPAVVAGATVTIPGGIMLPEALLVLDVLVIRPGEHKPELVVGEIKTYPDRAGYTDPGELASARAQAGVYVHGLTLVLSELGLADAFRVSTTGFLVLSRPGFNDPSIRAGEDLRYQAERARRGFHLLREAAKVVEPLPVPGTDAAIDVVLGARVDFSENCLMFCDRVAVCRAKAFADGDPAALGRDVARFLGEITLVRAMELINGSKPIGNAEQDLVRRIRENEGELPN